MNKVIFAILALAMTRIDPVQAQTVDCSQVFTPLEHAICANPELDSLDRELERLSDLAITQKVVSRQAIREMRNNLALQCSGSAQVAECLISQEQLEIVQLSIQTNTITEVAASYKPEPPDTAVSLRLKLENAERVYQATGEVDSVVKVTIELLRVYAEDAQFMPPAAKQYEIRALRARINAGCNNLNLRRQWNQALLVHGQSCSGPLRVVPPG